MPTKQCQCLIETLITFTTDKVKKKICTYDVEEIFQEFLQVFQSITCGNFIFLSFLYPPCYTDSVKGRINYPD